MYKYIIATVLEFEAKYCLCPVILELLFCYTVIFCYNHQYFDKKNKPIMAIMEQSWTFFFLEIVMKCLEGVYIGLNICL